MSEVDRWDEWVALCTPNVGLDLLAACSLLGVQKMDALWIVFESSFVSKRWDSNETLHLWISNLDGFMLFLSKGGKFREARVLEAAWVQAALTR